MDNKWEKACKEFLKGCSCADQNKQEECPECLQAFLNHLSTLATEEGIETNQHCINKS